MQHTAGKLSCLILLSVAQAAEAKASNWGDIATWFASVIALLALVLTLLQWWRNEWSRNDLAVMPPAVTQFNDTVPSLIVDVAFVNRGGRDAVLADVIVRLFSGGKDTGLALHAQHILPRESPMNGLALENATNWSVFLPVLCARNEPQALRLYCAPFAGNQSLKTLAETARRVDELQIECRIGGTVPKIAFRFPYLDFREKFTGELIEIPPKGFAPRWFRDEREVHLH
jgi:hypothetical protein